MDQYGADALRLMLIIGSTAGNDMRTAMKRCWLPVTLPTSCGMLPAFFR
ncbi:MAG: hypothetical protein Q3X09_03310 [Gemmiger sp.]|nr:hypothetical protein [Gemmiger sp.]